MPIVVGGMLLPVLMHLFPPQSGSIFAGEVFFLSNQLHAEEVSVGLNLVDLEEFFVQVFLLGNLFYSIFIF